MLAQESPFAGGNPAETSMNHLKHRCRPIGEIRKDIPPLISAWLMRLISRHPDDRPANAKEASRQFQDAVKGIPYQPMAEFGDVPEKKAPIVEVSGPPSIGPVGPPTSAVIPPKPALSTGPVVAPRLQTGAVKTATGATAGAQTTISQAKGQRRLSQRIRSVSGSRTPDLYKPVGRSKERDSRPEVNWKLILGIVVGLIAAIFLSILLVSR